MSEVAQAFDAAAREYDSTFGENPIAISMRGQVWETCLEIFKPGDRILDLNAGTGIDALYLARHGISVHAIDISNEMIDLLSRKLKGQSLSAAISAEVRSFETLEELRDMHFAGALSNFGGLNCVKDLSAVARGLAGVLQADSRFIACLMGPFCLVETLAFLRRGRLREAFRRLSTTGVQADVARYSIPVYYHSPHQFVSSFAPFFDLEEIYGIGIILPPSWKSDWAAKRKRSFKVLSRIDKILGRLPLLRAVGDHYVVQLRRKPSV